MSLINDALKKAQRQRTGEPSASQAPMPGASGASLRSGNGRGTNPQLLLLGIGAILGLLIATGAVLVFRDKSPSASASARPEKTVTESKSPTVAPTKAAPPATEPDASVAHVSSTSVVAAKSEPAPSASLVASTKPVTETAPPETLKIAVPVPSTPAPTAPKDGKPSLAMINAIEALRVAGIRAGTGTDAKVLMNDRVYRIGDTVDHALGIKLTAVTSNSLSFQDASGAVYTRNF
jgi:hypothetical protein